MCFFFLERKTEFEVLAKRMSSPLEFWEVFTKLEAYVTLNIICVLFCFKLLKIHLWKYQIFRIKCVSL
jgi:hypothetical protein